MNTLIIICLGIIVYWKIKNQHYARLNVRYSYKLYDLRDSLRELAVKQKIDANDWQFKYLDSSISKTVNELPSLNLYTSFMLYNKYKKSSEFHAHKVKLRSGIGENKYCHAIYEEYGRLINRYVIEKHFWLKSIIDLGLWSLLGSLSLIDILRTSFKKATGAIRIVPETSTTYNYC